MTLILDGVETDSGFHSIKTKKELKSFIGARVIGYDPSIFSDGSLPLPLVGQPFVLDHPKRSKFAQVWTDNDGLIQKVS